MKNAETIVEGLRNRIRKLEVHIELADDAGYGSIKGDMEERLDELRLFLEWIQEQ